jgi:hypothetical protein
LIRASAGTGIFKFETIHWVDWFNSPRQLQPSIPPPEIAKIHMTTEPKKKNMMPVFFIGLAGLIESVVAVTTGRQLDFALAIGLLVGAFSMWLQIRRKV